MYFSGKEKRDSDKKCGMRDSREKRAGMRDQEPYQTLLFIKYPLDEGLFLLDWLRC